MLHRTVRVSKPAIWKLLRWGAVVAVVTSCGSSETSEATEQGQSLRAARDAAATEEDASQRPSKSVDAESEDPNGNKIPKTTPKATRIRKTGPKREMAAAIPTRRKSSCHQVRRRRPFSRRFVRALPVLHRSRLRHSPIRNEDPPEGRSVAGSECRRAHRARGGSATCARSRGRFRRRRSERAPRAISRVERPTKRDGAAVTQSDRADAARGHEVRRHRGHHAPRRTGCRSGIRRGVPRLSTRSCFGRHRHASRAARR